MKYENIEEFISFLDICYNEKKSDKTRVSPTKRGKRTLRGNNYYLKKFSNKNRKIKIKKTRCNN